MPDYLSCAETAKLVRGALKRAFPHARFSVRSHVYAGGASIDVRYSGGPCNRFVERVAKQYQGSDFDGMVDLKTPNRHYLLPDGSALPSSFHRDGTSRAVGVVQGLPDGARLVRFGADFIFVHREGPRCHGHSGDCLAPGSEGYERRRLSLELAERMKPRGPCSVAALVRQGVIEAGAATTYCASCEAGEAPGAGCPDCGHASCDKGRWR